MEIKSCTNYSLHIKKAAFFGDDNDSDNHDDDNDINIDLNNDSKEMILQFK